MGIAMLLLGMLPGFFKAIPGIGATAQQIITDVTGSAAAILASGSLTQPNINTILAAWLGVINMLRTDPNLPATVLNTIAQLEKAVQAALTNDAKAAASVDWSLVNPITPVV